MAGFCVRPMVPALRNAPDPVLCVYSPREPPAACAGWPSPLVVFCVPSPPGHPPAPWPPCPPHGLFLSPPPLPFGETKKLPPWVGGLAWAAGAILGLAHGASAPPPNRKRPRLTPPPPS